MKVQTSVSLSDSEVMTREDVARWLKVRPRQLDRLGVPAVKFGRRTVRYFRADVAAWLDGCRNSHIPTRRSQPTAARAV